MSDKMRTLAVIPIFLSLLFTYPLLASTDLDDFSSIESIENATRFLMDSTNSEEAEVEAEKLARAVGKTIPNSGEEKAIKDAIITIEQIRSDERTLTLEYYFPHLEEITTEVEKIHVLRIWMIAFGAQRALYNAENGDLDDIKQHLLLLTRNPATKFKELLGKPHINSQQVLGEDFVQEVNARIPNVVHIRREQQLLRAQARTDFVIYMDDGTQKTKLLYKIIPDGQCGFYGLDTTRENSSDKMVWGLKNPRIKQWVTAAALNYLTPGSNGGANREMFVGQLQTRYGSEFSEHYNNWSELVSINDELNRSRDFTIRQLKQEKNELLKEKESHQDRLDVIAVEITMKSDLFVKSRVMFFQKIETAKTKFKEFLEKDDVLKFIVRNLYKQQEWMQFNGSNQDDEILDFGDVIAFLNNLKVYTISADSLGVVSISNSTKTNAKEIFLLYSLLPNGMTHYDRVIDYTYWRGQMRGERHAREFGLR
jgi:hypothetical protein